MGMKEPECRKGLEGGIGSHDRRDPGPEAFSVRVVNPVSTRRLVAVIAVALCLGGAVVYTQGNQAGGGVLLRSGLVLGSIWVAWPALTTLNRRWLVPAVIILAFAVTRPGLLIFLVPALLAFALLRHRGTK